MWVTDEAFKNGYWRGICNGDSEKAGRQFLEGPQKGSSIHAVIPTENFV